MPRASPGGERDHSRLRTKSGARRPSRSGGSLPICPDTVGARRAAVWPARNHNAVNDIRRSACLPGNGLPAHTHTIVWCALPGRHGPSPIGVHDPLSGELALNAERFERTDLLRFIRKPQQAGVREAARRASTSSEATRPGRMCSAPSARQIPRPWIRHTQPMPVMPGTLSSATTPCAMRAWMARRTFSAWQPRNLIH